MRVQGHRLSLQLLKLKHDSSDPAEAAKWNVPESQLMWLLMCTGTDRPRSRQQLRACQYLRKLCCRVQRQAQVARQPAAGVAAAGQADGAGVASRLGSRVAGRPLYLAGDGAAAGRTAWQRDRRRLGRLQVIAGEARTASEG